jgi:hypothetical protein
LNQFSINEKIGVGAFSKVYQAANVNSGVEFALKIIDKTKITTKLITRGIKADNYIHFYREIALTKKLDHPNICQLYEVIENEDSKEKNKKLYLVMEYLSKGSVLSDRYWNYRKTQAQVLGNSHAQAMAKGPGREGSYFTLGAELKQVSYPIKRGDMPSELSRHDSHLSFNESAVSAINIPLSKNTGSMLNINIASGEINPRSTKKKFTVNKKPKALPLVKCHKYFRDLLLGLDYCKFFL